MQIILGPEPKPSTGFMKIFDWLYRYVLVHVGSIIGSIIASLFILFDILYLNKRLRNIANSAIIRLLVIFIITVVVGATHYILEKVIDVI